MKALHDIAGIIAGDTSIGDWDMAAAIGYLRNDVERKIRNDQPIVLNTYRIMKILMIAVELRSRRDRSQRERDDVRRGGPAEYGGH